jgi:hypothetical protein
MVGTRFEIHIKSGPTDVDASFAGLLQSCLFGVSFTETGVVTKGNGLSFADDHTANQGIGIGSPPPLPGQFEAFVHPIVIRLHAQASPDEAGKNKKPGDSSCPQGYSITVTQKTGISLPG